MRTGLLCLLVFTVAAHGQVVERLNSDLMELRGLPAGDPLPNLTVIAPEKHVALRQHVIEQSPIQNQIMRHFSHDVAAAYGKPSLVPWNLAYALTTVLAGKEMSNETLTPLTNSILDAFDVALTCSAEGCLLGQSVNFRKAVERTYQLLLDLGVNKHDALQVAGGLMEGGRLVASPPGHFVHPIPPAGPVPR